MNEAAFAELVGATKAVVLAAVARNLPSELRHAIDDVVQETYISAYRRLTRTDLAAIESVQGYLYTVARNECLRWLRRNVREQEKAKRLESGDLFQKAGHEERAELAEVLDRIALLPAHQRSVMELAVSGLAEKEIAERLSVRPGTVKSRLSRARENLRRLLEGGRHEKFL